MKLKAYDYKNKYTNYIFPLLTLYLGTPTLFLFAIATLGIWVQGSTIIKDLWVKVIVSLLASFLWPWFVLQDVNMFPGLSVDKNGITVVFRNIFRRTKLIPWDEIYDVSPSTAKFHGMQVWVITVEERISFWHDILKKRYGSGEKPQLFVTSFLSGIDDFIEIVNEHIKSQGFQ